MELIRVMIVGGCFDVLHPGHLDFLKKARAKCDYLIVLLEPDAKVRMMKGKGRPKTNLELRIRNLEKTGMVDEIIALPYLKTDEEYEKEIKKIMAEWFYGSMAKKKTINQTMAKRKNNLDPRSSFDYTQDKLIINNKMVVGDDRECNGKNTDENIRANPLKIRENSVFVFGITKNDRNTRKNEKIKKLGEKLKIPVVEVNELLPEWSTTKALQKCKIYLCDEAE